MTDTNNRNRKPNPWRGHFGPSWRWLLAGQLATTARPRREQILDRLGEEAIAYRRLRSGDQADAVRAEADWPLIAAAEAMDQNTEVRDPLRILALGGCTTAEAASRLALDEGEIGTWEALFFDVADCLEAHGWIVAHVIKPQLRNGASAVAARMRLALATGPVGARVALDTEAKLPLDPAARLLDRKLKLDLKLDEVLNQPLVPGEASLRWATRWMELDLEGKKLLLEEKKLAQRCEETLRQHELAEQRLAATVERDRRRAEAGGSRQRQKAARLQKHEEAHQAVIAARAAEEQTAGERLASSPLGQLAWKQAAVARASAVPKRSGPARLNVVAA